MPRPSQRWIHRARLLDLLAARSDVRLVLVSAPPGFGKTTTLVDWLTTSNVRSAWLALDAGDNDGDRFLRYLWSAASMLAGAPPAAIAGAWTNGGRRRRGRRDLPPPRRADIAVGACPRRLPPHLRARGPPRGRAPPRPTPARRAARDLVPPGPRAPARAPPRAGGASRDPCRGSPVHQRGGRCVLLDADGGRTRGRRPRGADGAHRGLARRAPARRSVACRAERRHAARPGVRSEPSSRARLRHRRGPRAPRRCRPGVPRDDVGARSADRLPVRRADRTGRRSGHP